MSKTRSDHIKKMIVLLAVCGGSATMGFILGSIKVDTTRAYQTNPLQQSEQKLIERSDQKLIERNEFPNEPVGLANLRVKSVKISLHQKFSARSLTEKGGGQEADWIENLEFSLKNKSDKRITYISFQLQFPETEANGPRMAYDLSIGIPPNAPGVMLRHSTPLALSPGDSYTFTLSANELKLVKDFLGFGKFQLSDLNSVVITLVSTTFDDGTKWTLGRYYRPNPNAPGGYEPIDQ